jgi:azurin
MQFVSNSKMARNSFIPMLLAGALLAACGKKEETSDTATPAPAAAAVSAPIVITANDQMQFSTKAFGVAAGSEVVIILQNVGTMAKEVMGHNLTVLNAGTAVPEFATKAMAAKETDYIPQGDAAILAHTRLLGPGESDTLTFTAPAAGEYPYVCTFPGHFAMRQGVMTVK